MNIGIIGFGNLGKALVEGIITKGIVEPCNIYVCAKSNQTISMAKETYKVNANQDVNWIIENSDLIFLILKEKGFCELAKSLDKHLLSGKTIVSFMAGITIRRIKDELGLDIAISRAMPNIAISHGDGLIGYTDTDDERVMKLYEQLGFAFKIEENEIDMVTAFLACGLGLTAYIIKAFVDAGVKLGLNEALSQKIMLKTFQNAIDMENFEDTIKMVATKGGATEKGISFYEESKIEDIIYGGIERSYEKCSGGFRK